MTYSKYDTIKYPMCSGRLKGGFTLIEIIVGLGVMAIMLIAFLTLFALSFRVNDGVDQNSKAFYLAESYIEKIYGNSGGDHASLANRNGFSLKSGEINVFDKTEDGFYLTLKLADSEGLRRVLIRVYDSSDPGTQKQLAQIEDLLPLN